MSKTKLRCMTCGKWFQSANAREVTCPDCTQKARKEKQAQKNAPTTATKTGPGTSIATAASARPAPPPKPKAPSGGTLQWLDKVADVKIAQPEQPVVKPKAAPPVHRETAVGPDTGGNRSVYDRGEGEQRLESSAYRGGNGTAGAPPTIGPRPRQPMGGPVGSKPWQKGNGSGGPGASRPSQGGPKRGGKPKSKVNTPPKPKKEKTPPPAPFVPTEEQVKQVEERYTALAQPAEFDGIRTQIAKELSIPKKTVKKIIKDFRGQEHIPSWWELQTYKGSSEELEKIKAVYQPYLPVPPVGVHKNIAETLALKPGIVYQAIKTIRQEMELPQYNNPDLHEEELKQIANKRQAENASKDAELKQGDSEKEASTTPDQSQNMTPVEAKDEEISAIQVEEQKPEEKQEHKEDVTTYE
ncbi:MAG: hypothetical protein H0U76_12870 [Ktedonobacteraceae bacterium]|nr:hypothetical protein [Ktedonobacteraceae bacterium]